jgi:PAS domain-containing protein
MYFVDAGTLFNLGFQHWQAFLLAFIPALITVGAIVYFSKFPPYKLNRIYLIFLIGICGWQMNDSISRLSLSEVTAKSWDRMLIFVYLSQFPFGLHFDLLLAGKKKFANSISFIVLIYFPTFLFAILLCSGFYSQSYTYSSFWGWARTFNTLQSFQTLPLIWVSILILFSAITLGSFAYKNRAVPETKFISLFIFLGYIIPVIIGFTMEVIFPLFLKINPVPITATVMSSIVIVLSQLIAYKIFFFSETLSAERIAEIIQEIIFVVSSQGIISYINPYGASATGNEVIKIKKLEDVFPISPITYQAFEKQVIVPGFQKAKPTNFQFSREEKGKEINWHVSTYPIFNRKKVDGLLVMCRDVTSQIHIAESKLAALRSQMNPHFIFNSLNSIQHYIHSNQREAAESFLSTFAVLMRKILDNSANAFIPLADELITIELYLKLEKARFGNRLNYKITVDNCIDIEEMLIPSMLIQPYIENAILHGLTPKDEGGSITIQISKQANYITCSIKDDGIGRKKALEIKNKQLKHNKSRGISITKARLEILNEQLNIPVAVSFSDLYDDHNFASGTRVEINIPVQERF